MIIKVQLSEKDRERLGAPEWLPVDPNAVSWKESVVLQKGIEVDVDGVKVVFAYDSPDAWRAALKSPMQPAALGVLVWLAARRANLLTSLADFDFDLDAVELEIERDTADPGEPGKDPSIPETTSS